MTEHDSNHDRSDVSANKTTNKCLIPDGGTDNGETYRFEGNQNGVKIPVGEMSVKTVDGRPVIKIGATRIYLEVHYVDREDGMSFSTFGDGVETEIDADGDNVWWSVFEDFSGAYVEIDPLVGYIEEEGSA
jgi:hypothetical protein